MTDDEIDLKNKNAAAEYLGANALDLIKQILIKHDRAILEESHRLIQEAIKKEREECAKLLERRVTGILREVDAETKACAAAIRARSTNEVQVSP